MSWQGLPEHYTPLRLSFGRRYYAWCVEQVESEARTDFPLLRRLRGTHSLQYLSWVDALPPKEREAFALSMLDKLFESVLPVLGVSAASNHSLAENFAHHRSLVYQGLATDASAASHTNGSNHTIKRKLLRSALTDGVAPLFTQGLTSVSSDLLMGVTEVGSWKICTELDLEGSNCQLGYRHTIRLEAKAGAPQLWYFDISAFSWLGVSGQTDLTFFTEAELPQLVSAVHDASTRFLRAVPELLA